MPDASSRQRVYSLVRIAATEVVVLIDQPQRKLRFDAAAGNGEALAELVRNHGRSVRVVLAQYVDRWAAVEQLEVGVWNSLRLELSTIEDLVSALTTTARAAALTYLEGADRQAIQERDVLRRLVVQVALEELRGQPLAMSPADQIQERLKLLSSEQYTLLDLYYIRSVALTHISTQRNVPLAELAHEACLARAACDWRPSAPAPAGDRLIPSLTEDLLSDTLDPDSRALLATSVAQDLSRSVRLERQVRLHLLLRAVMGPFTPANAQSVAANALGQVQLARTQTASALGSGRTRLRNSDVLRTPSGNRRTVSHAKANKTQPLIIGVVIVAGLLVLGVLLMPERGSPPAKAPVSVATTTANVEPIKPAPPAAVPATPPNTITPGASALRPEQLATPSDIPPLPAAPSESTPPVTVPIETPPATSVAVIESVALINADTNKPIPGYEVLPQDVTIRLSQLPSRNINFKFNAPPDIRTIRFSLPGCSLKAEGVEKKHPFSLGDGDGKFDPWTPPPGVYQLTLSACSDPDGKQVVRTSTWRIRFEE